MMYIYNRVVLPEPPEWDKVKYPYACITSLHAKINNTYGYQTYYTFIAFDRPVTIAGGGFKPYKGYSAAYWLYETYKGDTGWVLRAEITAGMLSDEDGVLWSNFDILHDVYGSVEFYASPEPVPVPTGIDHKALAQGLIVGKRIAEMRGQKKSNVDGGATAILGVGSLGTMILGYDGGITLV